MYILRENGPCQDTILHTYGRYVLLCTYDLHGNIMFLKRITYMTGRAPPRLRPPAGAGGARGVLLRGQRAPAGHI